MSKCASTTALRASVTGLGLEYARGGHRAPRRLGPVATSCPIATSSIGLADLRSVPTQLLESILHDDMQAVDRVLRDSLGSDVVLIRRVAEYIIGSGGKRLRPALLLLSARACGYRGSHHHTLAAVIEMIHTATLLHDDVVDESSLRRGHATANATFGNAASVLVGDFLYSRAFQLMVTTESVAVLRILADATNVIAGGEVMQLMGSHDPEVDEARYLEVIRRKTAKLFEAAARLGAVLARSPGPVETGLARYGAHV